MATVEQQQAPDFPRDAFPPPVPRHPHGHAPQNPGVLPVSPNGQPEGYWQDVPQPVGIVGAQIQEPHRDHFDVAYRGTVDYHPPPLHDPAAQYVFPDVGHAQEIYAQGQPNAPNQEHAFFGRALHRVAPVPAQAASRDRDSLAHQIPAPGQPASRNLRRLASRYLHHPDSQIGIVCRDSVEVALVFLTQGIGCVIRLWCGVMEDHEIAQVALRDIRRRDETNMGTIVYQDHVSGYLSVFILLTSHALMFTLSAGATNAVAHVLDSEQRRIGSGKPSVSHDARRDPRRLALVREAGPIIDPPPTQTDGNNPSGVVAKQRGASGK
ncbi:hypothetical protein BC827DRAFT_1154856 [Russula dissimulans]|nr:hypothetical protein BC827DRAFT_1154856 [Russula dissimulans]